MKAIHKLFAGFLCVAAIQVASAQSYPSKPVRLIFPSGPGASNDILSRALAKRLSEPEALGRQVMVENRPGASGNIGAEMVAKSAPDGYTLLVGYTTVSAIGPSVYLKLNYDPVNDLVPVVRFAVVPFVLVVHPSVPATNIRELIALSKARPGQLNYASAGSGSLPHLTGELLKIVAGIDMVHVPYKASSDAGNGLVGGQVQLYFTGISGVLPFIKSGKLRAIAVTTLKRSPQLQDVPTMHESGLAEFDVSSWVGLLAPARTPAPVIQRIYDEIAKIVDTPDMREFILSQGAEPDLMDPRQFAASLKAEIPKWANVVKTANLKLE